MTIKTQWLNDEKQIMVMQFDPRWTWEDIYGMIAESRAMLDAVEHPVGLIIDYRKSIGVPGAAFPNLRALVQKRSPNIAITVMVGLKPQTRAFWELFTRVYAILTRNRKYQVADSIEQAETLIYASLESADQGAAR